MIDTLTRAELLQQEARRYLRYVRPGTWEITAPHLLYATRQQADAYSRIKAENKTYDAMHDSTIALIDHCAADISRHFSPNFTFVDLGPERPDKTVPLLEQACRNGFNCDYAAVDVDVRFAITAAKAIAPMVRHSVGIPALFAECASQLTAQQELFAHRVVFIGLTYMNFPPGDILQTMRQIAGQQGIVIVAQELLTRRNQVRDVMAKYNDAMTIPFAFGPAGLLGFRLEQLEFDTQFKRNRAEIGFHVKETIETCPIEPGDFLITATSRRQTRPSFERLFAAHTDRPSFWYDPANNIGLALGHV